MPGKSCCQENIDVMTSPIRSTPNRPPESRKSASVQRWHCWRWARSVNAVGSGPTTEGSSLKTTRERFKVRIARALYPAADQEIQRRIRIS